jgi:hypothetical protein
MDQEGTLTRARLRTPRAAAIAGILFSILLIISLVLIWVSVPADPHRDLPVLDGVPRLRAGAVAPPKHRLSLLGSGGLPAAGPPDQRLQTPCES